MTGQKMLGSSQVPERPGGGWQRWVAVLIWVALAGSFVGYSLVAQRSPTEVLRDLVGLLQTPAGPLLYILIYTLRPLAFFSAIVVTLLGGAIWGPLFGTLYVVIGSNLSASLAYLFGRAFGQGLIRGGEQGGVVARYAAGMRRNAFTTVLVMRLIYLPYDLVNYLAGLLRVGYRPFILATLIGSFPGTLTFVLVGASLKIDDIFAGRFSVAAINPWTLTASLVLFVGGLAVSRYLRARQDAVDS